MGNLKIMGDLEGLGAKSYRGTTSFYYDLNLITRGKKKTNCFYCMINFWLSEGRWAAKSREMDG